MHKVMSDMSLDLLSPQPAAVTAQNLIESDLTNLTDTSTLFCEPPQSSLIKWPHSSEEVEQNIMDSLAGIDN